MIGMVINNSRYLDVWQQQPTMAQKPVISAQDTLQFLHDQGKGEVSDLTLLKGGEWSQAYSFLHHGKKYVLRWCNSSETFEKDTVASRFSCEAMPIPRIVASGIAFDTHFAISEFVQGDFFDTLAADKLNKVRPALWGLFDALRTTPLTNTTGYGGWDKNGVGSHKSWKEYLLAVNEHQGENLTQGWYVNLATSSIGTAIFDQLYAQFEPLVDDCPEVRELIHSDLLNYNLLVSDANISGVIDWQCSLYGDSLYDVAWFVFYAPWYPQFTATQLCQHLIMHYESVTAEHADLHTRLLCYQLHIGLGSIAYNAFKQDWKAVQSTVEYTRQLANQIDS